MSGYKNGSVKISNDILSVIALAATSEVEGVKKVYGESLDNAETVSTRVNDKGIRMEMINERLKFDIDVIIEPNRKILDICKNIQRNVAEKIEIMTGLSVYEVNINVLRAK